MLQIGLVKFLIEHFFRIFEEEVTSPEGENTLPQDNCPEASGTLNSLTSRVMRGSFKSGLVPLARPPIASSTGQHIAQAGRFHTGVKQER